MEQANMNLDPLEERYEHYVFNVVKGQQPLRIDKYLMNFVENATRNKIQAAAKSWNIFVNDVVVKSNYKVKSDDKVTVVYDNPKETYDLIAQNIPINIISRLNLLKK